MRPSLKYSLLASISLNIVLAGAMGYLIADRSPQPNFVADDRSAHLVPSSPSRLSSTEFGFEREAKESPAYPASDAGDAARTTASAGEIARHAPPSKQTPPASPTLFNTDPSARGNAFVIDGSQISVETTSSPETGSAVDLVITSLDNAQRSTSPGPRESGGLTQEQQAFRAKWGWAVFDQAQRAAKGFDR